MATHDVASLDAMIGEVKRELALRGAVYPRIVASRKLKQERADMQLGLMRSILGVLETLRDEAASRTTRDAP